MRIIIQTKGKAQKDGFALRNYQLILFQFFEFTQTLKRSLNLIVPPTFDLFECEEIITKVPVYAVERIEAMKRVGFKKSTKLLVGTMDGYAYKDYWTINRGVYIPLDDLEAKEKA